ncbi:uncharacterized protein DUF4433 [Mangrovibacterium marinum]|uniref:Uncharacterized protein DUF4433 n=1 Tax=Mangrovibacterium marinum TaxID=1639118 RepID=A0A2T5C3F4_9BACT|nr:DarT ssDNA thymidine ADP-ribosyltransferase family protein [Mangrovibacterium marinum]PTN09297.1 uncharacterized protein DUF4433 [Mangrovibacterium marinum]
MVKEESVIRNVEFVLNILTEIRILLDNAISQNDCKSLSHLIDQYDELFYNEDIKKYVKYKITGVGNSTHALFSMDMNGPYARKHITLSLSPELDMIDSIYSNKLSELIMFFKYLFSAVENLAIYQNQSKLTKYLAVLKEIEISIRNFIIQHTQVSEQQDELNRLLRSQEEYENHLRTSGVVYKSESDLMSSFLQKNGINSLYHFTDSQNLESIKNHGGLFSRAYCNNKGLQIAYPGGDQFSWQLDKMKNATNYVRLSFCREHPMKSTVIAKRRMKDPVVLEIDTSVIDLIGTKFCDKNASRSDAIIRYDKELLKNLPFHLFNKDYSMLGESEKEAFQAEVLVYEKIPLEYIRNL